MGILDALPLVVADISHGAAWAVLGVCSAVLLVSAVLAVTVVRGRRAGRGTPIQVEKA